jgi:ferredoxin-NADP reductase
LLKLAHHITTVVRSVRRETDRITVYELADPDGWELPPFTPGAHLDVRLPSGTVRTYSLCGDCVQSDRFWVAIQREDCTRGGSQELHRWLQVGTIVPVSLPRNHFPLAASAPHSVMIAGGIGITPFLSMIASLWRSGGRFTLHYCARTPAEMAFRDFLREAPYRDWVRFYFSRVASSPRLDVAQIVADASEQEPIYCCGPRSLVDEVLERTSGRAPDRVRVERFGAAGRPAISGESLTVALERSGRLVQVIAGETILEALRKADVDIDSSCEAGVCTSCKVRYLEGVPIHRDLVLSADQRRQFMLPCVSGCSSSRLVLDL